MKLYSQFHLPCLDGQVIKSASLTVPNLAPSLVEIIEASINGDPMPMCGTPLYDDSEGSGIARLMASKASLGEQMIFAQDNTNKDSIKPENAEKENISANEGENSTNDVTI